MGEVNVNRFSRNSVMFDAGLFADVDVELVGEEIFGMTEDDFQAFSDGLVEAEYVEEYTDCDD